MNPACRTKGTKLLCSLLLALALLTNSAFLAYSQEEPDSDQNVELDLAEYGAESEVAGELIDHIEGEVEVQPEEDGNIPGAFVGVEEEEVEPDAGTAHRVFMPLVVGGSRNSPEQAVAAEVEALDAEATSAASVAGVYGDFNNDGFDDLAIGVPDEDLFNVSGTIVNAGAVNVIYGSRYGLTTTLAATLDQFWHQNSFGITDTAELNDRFGLSVAVADFNGDAYDDLAIGVPFENLELASGAIITDAGMVNVIYGSRAGLHSSLQIANQRWHKESAGIDGFAQLSEQFGSALTTGDFNRDGYGDLAIGAPRTDISLVVDAGTVSIIYGSSQGLHPSQQRADQVLSQLGAVAGEPERGDQFGLALTSGDFNGDSYRDLAIGVPLEDINVTTQINSGAVNVVYGSAAGLNPSLTVPAQTIWYKDNTRLKWAAESYERFGWALTAGDFDGNGFADLAIGVPFNDAPKEWDDVGEVVDAGSVYILHGTATGLTSIGYEILDQTNAIPNDNSTDPDDHFGYALAAGNFNRTRSPIGTDRYDDLAVGVPGENIGSRTDAGAVNIFYGSPQKFSQSPYREQFFSQATTGVPGEVEVGDRFGTALAVGNYHGNYGFDDDLTIGVPWEDIGQSQLDAGAVNVLFGSANGLSTTNSQLWYQGYRGVNDAPETNDHFGQVAQ